MGGFHHSAKGQPNHKIEASDQTFAYIRNLEFSELTAAGKTVFLVNATDDDRLNGRVRAPAGMRNYQVQIFNRFLKAEPNRLRFRTDRDGVLGLNVAVQQGGLVVLSPIESANNSTAPDDDSGGREIRRTRRGSCSSNPGCVFQTP